MKNIKWTILAAVAFILVVVSWFGYLKLTDDTYEGMSIIPEQTDDIPLFEGLKPTRNNYLIEGDRWNDVYDFYFKRLPELGWKNEFVGTALDDSDPDNDWGGFMSRWTKEGFAGELNISASYNEFEEKTEVHFDKNAIHHSTTWINKVPESICIYKNSTNKECNKIIDKDIIRTLVAFINNAIDWDEKALDREKAIIIDFGEIKINVHYKKGEEIYLQSEKGLKLMKPEPEFLILTGLSQ